MYRKLGTQIDIESVVCTNRGGGTGGQARLLPRTNLNTELIFLNLFLAFTK